MCYCQVVWIKGHGRKRIIVLKNDMKGKDGTFHFLKLSFSLALQPGVIIWRSDL